MSEYNEKRADRLVMFRKLERELASRDVENARNAAKVAESAVNVQKEQVADESKRAQESNSLPVSPEDIQLALACVEAARRELELKMTVLKKTEKELHTKSKALLSTHRKVEQMEALKNSATSAAKIQQKRREQAEIDDLAVNRKARR
jgi:flagellar export protein FliJ